jgi:tetratricopeptide (TPR) repeat protein
VIDTAPPAPAPRAELRQNHTATNTKKKRKLTPLQRAQVALDSREYQHAEDILVDYIVQHTKDTKAYMLLGNIAMARSEWAECVEIFEQVMRLRPEEPGAQAGLGIAAYNLGRYAKALPALQRAHEEDPTNLTVLNDLLAIAKRMDNAALQHSIQVKLEGLETSAATRPVGQPS